MIRLLAPFAPLFSERVWEHARLLLTGAILAPGKRTVASALRAVGLENERRFCRYHRVLNRAVWSSREASRVLLGLLVEAFAPEGPLVVGIDETLERRQGKKIVAKGIYRDPVRSSHTHFLKTSALRWVCVTLLVPIPWASRIWALPFLSALTPSERYTAQRGKRYKKLTEWAWQLLLQVRRWHPERQLVAVADGGYASLKLLDRCRRLKKSITFITRLRLDAALYEPAPPRRPGQIGRPRLKGERLPNLCMVAKDPSIDWAPTTVANWYGESERSVEIISDTAVWHSTGLPAVPLRWVLIRDPQGEFDTQALLCTDLSVEPEQIILWFVRRWQMEATFQEVRQRVGFESQRHWSEMATQRTGPAMLALFSVITLLAHQYMRENSAADAVRQTAWYR
ncbi:MAG TPA: transposase, partial [Candidatus Acidoferrum sp.]|nr:transposase [Candidatus Acidoferrum sp.]